VVGSPLISPLSEAMTAGRTIASCMTHALIGLLNVTSHWPAVPPFGSLTVIPALVGTLRASVQAAPWSVTAADSTVEGSVADESFRLDSSTSAPVRPLSLTSLPTMVLSLMVLLVTESFPFAYAPPANAAISAITAMTMAGEGTRILLIWITPFVEESVAASLAPIGAGLYGGKPDSSPLPHRCQTERVLDERWIRSLHVEAMRHADLHEEREPHVLFQASTIGALIDGAYEGDVTLGELAGHGDLGLGTLNGLDGEMIVVDGKFYRANVEGKTHEVGPDERTPFGVVVPFSATDTLDLDQSLSQEQLLAALDERMPAGSPTCAVRIDGRFASVRARSVPKQEPPYRPLTEVVAEQHVFEIEDEEGTMVGFRFPEFAEGIEVSGYHLHFITADRSRGGHVLDFETAGVRAGIDPSAELHVELPPGIELDSAEAAGDTHAAIERVEHQG